MFGLPSNVTQDRGTQGYVKVPPHIDQADLVYSWSYSNRQAAIPGEWCLICFLQRWMLNQHVECCNVEKSKCWNVEFVYSKGNVEMFKCWMLKTIFNVEKLIVEKPVAMLKCWLLIIQKRGLEIMSLLLVSMFRCLVMRILYYIIIQYIIEYKMKLLYILS